MQDDEKIKTQAKIFELELMLIYKAPIIGGEELIKILGFHSNEAFRQALARNVVDVDVFSVRGRRGKFATIENIALWMAMSALKPIGDPMKQD